MRGESSSNHQWFGEQREALHSEPARPSLKQRPDASTRPNYVAVSRTRIRNPGYETILIQIHALHCRSVTTPAVSTNERALSRSSRTNPEFIRVALSRAPGKTSTSHAGGRGSGSDRGAQRDRVTPRPFRRQWATAVIVLVGLTWLTLCIYVFSTLLDSWWLG
jgi:hypothetical protein